MEWEIVDKQVKHQGFFRLEKYRLRHALFSGGWSPVISRELFERGHAVAVLPYDPVRDEVVLLEQFRIGALEDPQGPWLLEVVAGMIEAGETEASVARRESLEEAGCEVRELIPITRYYASPGGSSETISLFCALVDTSAVEGIHGLDEEDEDIRVDVVPRETATRWVEQGDIDSAAPIIALQWLALNRERFVGR